MGTNFFVIFISYAYFGSHLSILLGALTGAITTPLDVIKTRLMIQVSSVRYLLFLISFILCATCLILPFLFCVVCFLCVLSQGSANQYKGIVNCVKTIVREEGPPALLKVRMLQILHLVDLRWLFAISVFCFLTYLSIWHHHPHHIYPMSRSEAGSGWGEVTDNSYPYSLHREY